MTIPRGFGINSLGSSAVVGWLNLKRDGGRINESGELWPTFATIPPVTKADLYGKTVVITGGNGGIGYEAVKHFSTMNPGKIIIACRSKERGEAAVEKLKSETGYTKVEVRLLDLAKFSSVVSFADTFQQEQRLDLLKCNASVLAPDFKETEDGWEETIQVNHWLRPCTYAPRIVIVGSTTYWSNFGEVKEANFLRKIGSKDYCTSDPSVMGLRYGDSKLLTLLLARALSDALRDTPIVVNVVCPGFCLSDLRRDVKNSSELFMYWVFDTFVARISEEGGRQLVWAALSPNQNETMRGAWISWMKIAESSDYSLSKEGVVSQQFIWTELVEELSRVDPKFTATLNSMKISVT